MNSLIWAWILLYPVQESLCTWFSDNFSTKIRIEQLKMDAINYLMSNFRQIPFARITGAVTTPALVLLILTLLILPIPAFMLDIMFTFNIVLSLLIIMVAINTSTPMEFSVSYRYSIRHGHETGPECNFNQGGSAEWS